MGRAMVGCAHFRNARAISVGKLASMCPRREQSRDNGRVRLIRRLRLLMVGLVVICRACACDRVSGRPLVRVAGGYCVARPAGKPPRHPVLCRQSARRRGQQVGRCSRCCSRCRHRPALRATAEQFHRHSCTRPGARCLVHESMAEGLAAAAAVLRPHGQVLVFWDCYHFNVQVRMFDVRFTARPGWRGRGRGTRIAMRRGVRSM